jgi:tetratricopeptide (TPR) repeat protein
VIDGRRGKMDMENGLNSTREDISFEERLKFEKIIKSATTWIAAIGILSLLNSIMEVIVGGNLNFLVGLGTSKIISGLGYSNTGRMFAIIVNVLLASGFYLLSYWTKKHNERAMAAALVFYTVDSLIFLYIEDYFTFIFHLLAIAAILSGISANRKLSKNRPIKRLEKVSKRYKKIVYITLTAFILVCAVREMEVAYRLFMNPIDRADAYFEEGSYEEAVKLYRKLALTNRNNYIIYLNIGTALLENGKYEEALEAMKEANRLGYDDKELHLGLGYLYYRLNRFEDSIKEFSIVLKLEPNNIEAIASIAYCNAELGNNEEAITLADRAIGLNNEYAFAYEAKGEAYFYKGKFGEALKNYDIAITKDSTDIDLYYKKMSALLYLHEYEEVINFALEAEKKFYKDAELYYYIADSYSALGDTGAAIKYYEEALKVDESRADVLVSLGWEYYYNQDYKKAEIYAEKAMNIHEEDKSALSLKKAIEEQARPEAVKIVEFIKENYLYIDEIENFEQESEKFLSKASVTGEDVKEFIEKVKLDKDIFSFVIYGNEYENLISCEKSTKIGSEILDSKRIYVRIDNFFRKTPTQFKALISKLTNTEDMELVIDLRDNGGGLAMAANEILDVLLPEKTVSYLINRDGKANEYVSGESYTRFKKIIILVNEKSASSSELLALGLKKHLNNVTIVGKPTFGKGVGQITYENKADKYCIYLVNFYWNVKEKNITGERIYPDISVTGTRLIDYLNKIKEK